MKKTKAVNAGGLPIGEDHPRAKLCNHDVDLILDLRAEVKPNGDHVWSYGALARMFDCSKSQIRNIVLGRQRAQNPDHYTPCT